MNTFRGGWLILFTLLCAMVLAILHLPETWPDWLGWLRPAWVALVLFYWVMELPDRVGLVAAWMTGLAVDVLQADPLGLNGALLAAITWFGWRFYERLRMYTWLQQGAVIAMLLIGTGTVHMVVLALIDGGGVGWHVLASPLMSFFAWPMVLLALHALRRRIPVS